MQTGWGKLSDIRKVVASLPNWYTRTGAQRMVRLGPYHFAGQREEAERPGLYRKGHAASGRN
jgi:hypothetical protein